MYTEICWPGILLLFDTLIEHNQITVTNFEKYIHLHIITKTITIKHIVVQVLGEAHAWHSSISTFCSLQNVTSNSSTWVHPCKNAVTICLPNSTHASISMLQWNWCRETVLPLLGQKYFWLTAEEGDACDITLSTAGNMWQVRSVMSWYMYSNLTATRGSKMLMTLIWSLTSSHPLLVVAECYQWGHCHWRWGLWLYRW